MRRRELVIGVAGFAAWPLVARGQQPIPVVGFLNSASERSYANVAEAFRQGLIDAGYVEGRNVAVEYRWAEDQYERLPALAAELVERRVAIIVANTPAVLPAKAATTTIPIVFLTAADPVKTGLVASLSRPGGNLTGVSVLNVELGAKRLEMLHQLLPMARVVGLLVNPSHPATQTTSRDLQEAAETLGLKLEVLQATTERDLAGAFEAFRRMGAAGIVIAADPLFIGQSEQLAALALHYAIPAIFQFRPFAAAGGLMSYGPGDVAEPYRHVGTYVGRVLSGDKPADLPVQQFSKLELVINVKAAKALGITVPEPLLRRADEVIE